MMSEPLPANSPATDWEQHWNLYAEATALNPANAFRRRTIFRILRVCGLKPGSTVLDVGCGSGDFLACINQYFTGVSLAGIDHSQTGLDVTGSKFPDAILKQVDLESDNPIPPGLRDWASHTVCSEVLEHLHDPVLALRNIGSCMEPGGVLVVTVPGGPKSAFDRTIGHLRHYNTENIRDDLEQAGYVVEQATGAGFPMFNLYRLVVLLRGDQLSKDICGTPSILSRFAMALFRVLLYLTLPYSPWGWQIVAVARKAEK